MLHVKNYQLKYLFLFFFSFIKCTLSYGTLNDVTDAENTNKFTQSHLIFSTSTEQLSSSDLDHLEEEAKDTDDGNLLPLETLLSNELDNISRSYILSFRGRNLEESNQCFLFFKYLTSLIGGVGASFPVVGVALTIGKHYNSSLLGYYLATTSALSAAGISSWMIWELIDNARNLFKSHQSQSAWCSGNIEFLKKTGITLLAVVLGIFSTVPDVYANFQYSQIKGMFLLSFLYEAIPRTLGFFKFFSSVSCKSCSPCQSQENVLKDRALQIIDLSKSNFLKIVKEDDVETVTLNLEGFTTPREIYAYLSNGYLSQDLIDEEILPNHYYKGTPRILTQVVSLIFPIGTAFASIVLAYKGFKLLTDNPVLLGILSSFSIFPSVIVSSSGIIQVAGGLFDKIYSCRSKLSSKDFFDTFYPKTKLVFIGTSLLLASSAAIGGAYIIVDSLENTFLSPTKYVFSSLAVLSGITFGTYAITTSLMNFGEAILKKCLNGANYVLGCLNKLDKLRNLVNNSNPDELNNFVTEMGT